MRAQDVTPASEPHMNGTTDAGTGIQEGVEPCSPVGKRPIMWRIPSYSKKYKPVPKVSRTVRLAGEQHPAGWRVMRSYQSGDGSQGTTPGGRTAERYP